MKWYSLVLLGFSIGFTSCTNDTTEEGGSGDSVVVNEAEILADTTGIPATTIAPELLGMWILQEMRIDQEPMSIEDIGESAYEFRSDGTLVAHSEESASDPTPFTYDNNTINSDLNDKPLQVEELGPKKLVLSTEINGTIIRYIYQKGSL